MKLNEAIDCVVECWQDKDSFPLHCDVRCTINDMDDELSIKGYDQDLAYKRVIKQLKLLRKFRNN